MTGDYQAQFAPKEYPVNIVIDANISDHNIGLMLESIDLWNERIKTEVLYATITYNLAMHGKCNYAVLTDNVALPLEADGKTEEIGLTTYGSCADDIVNVETMETRMKLTANDYFTDRAVIQIGAHELGHVLGLDHEPKDHKSMMFPTIGDDPRVISDKSYCLVKISMAMSGY
jgi:hypothetical protein